MILFIGLGNPGMRYHNTLHNAGFIAIENIRHNLGSAEPWSKKFTSLWQNVDYHGEKIIFVEPQTYMNNSGIPVSQFKKMYKIENDRIFVFHDDIDLQPGRIKIKTGGGNGGHNGLKSLDAYIGNDYHRIRIGVGRPLQQQEVSNFVLSQFHTKNLKDLEIILTLFSENLHFLLEKQFSCLIEKLILL